MGRILDRPYFNIYQKQNKTTVVVILLLILLLNIENLHYKLKVKYFVVFIVANGPIYESVYCTFPLREWNLHFLLV